MEFINQYLNKKKILQEIILDYIDNENNQEGLNIISSYLENEKIRENKKEFLELIKMIASISKNHHHSTDFYQKIEQIITLFKNDIPKVFSNMEVFNIFKNNIRILLFLLNEKIIVLEYQIVSTIRRKYSFYFSPEIKEFTKINKNNEIERYIINESDDDNSTSYDDSETSKQKEENKDDESEDELDFFKQKEEKENKDDESEDELDFFKQKEENKDDESDKELKFFKQKEENKDDESEDELKSFKQKEEKENKDDESDKELEIFKQKRLIGENDDIICQFIRNDKINEFISYVNQNGIKIDSKINSSDFETNSFLRKNSPTIIEYAAFFGSINIFKYLIVNKCKIKPSIWQYSIHGMNPEIIHILEEKQIKPKNNSFLDCFYESLKCHHIDFSNYLSENYITDIDKKSKDIIFLCMKLNNFNAILYLFGSKFTDYQFLNHVGFMNICLYYDYINLVDFLLKQDNIDINQRTCIITENKYTKTKNYESVIHIAFDKGNDELLKLILSNPKIDVNQIKTTEFFKKEKKSNIYRRIDNYINNFLNHNGDDNDDEDEEIIQEKIEYSKEDTILNNALTDGNLEIVKLLLAKQNINPNIKTIIKKDHETDEYVALNIAIEKEYFDIARILISIKDIDVNLKTKIGENVKTPLSILFSQNNMEFIKELITKTKIDVNQSIQCTGYRNKQYQKYYYHYNDENDDYMYYNSDDEYYYRDNSPQKVNQEKNILYIAIEKNDIDLVKLLLSRKDINVNIKTNEGSSSFYMEDDKETPLFLAVKMQNIEIIQMLLAHPKIDVNKKSKIAGSYSERYGRINCVGCIKTDKNPLYLAIEKGYTEIVRLLLNAKNIDLNERFLYKEKAEEEKTLLHVAIDSGNTEIVQLLLEQKNIDVNAQKKYSFTGEFCHMTISLKTPLFLAVEKNSPKMVQYLLNRKDIQINEKSIFTRKGCTKYVEFVVNYEGDKDALPAENEDFREEKTVLQMAIEKRNAKIVGLLLSQPEINVNEIITSKNIISDLETGHKTHDNTSTTALHIAVINRNLEIIKLLLNHKKINVNVVDNRNKRPIDLTKDAAIIDIFKK